MQFRAWVSWGSKIGSQGFGLVGFEFSSMVRDYIVDGVAAQLPPTADFMKIRLGRESERGRGGLWTGGRLRALVLRVRA